MLADIEAKAQAFYKLQKDSEDDKLRQQGLLTEEQKAEQDIVKLAKQHTAEAIAALVFWANCRTPVLAPASIKAAEILINRAHGVATQKIEHLGEGGQPFQTNFNIVFVNRDEVLAKQGKIIEHQQDLEKLPVASSFGPPVPKIPQGASPSVVMKPKIVLKKMNGARA